MRSANISEVAAAAPSTSTLLHRLAKKITRNTPEEELGMRLRQYWVLSHLAEHDGVAQHELAEAFLIDANNVVLLLNELESAGFIERRRDPTDRRRHLVFVTDEGRKALTGARAACTHTEDKILAALDRDERDTLRRLLIQALED